VPGQEQRRADDDREADGTPLRALQHLAGGRGGDEHGQEERQGQAIHDGHHDGDDDLRDGEAGRRDEHGIVQHAPEQERGQEKHACEDGKHVAAG
jgi:hypothetical protein